LAVIFVAVVLVLAGPNTFLWRFLIATLAAVIFDSFGSKNTDAFVFFE
jgi:hypothetical protein